MVVAFGLTGTIVMPATPLVVVAVVDSAEAELASGGCCDCTAELALVGKTLGLALAEGVTMDGSSVVRSGRRDGERVCADVGANEKLGNVVSVVRPLPTPLLPPFAGDDSETGGGEDAEASGEIVVVENLVLILVIVNVVALSDGGAALFASEAALLGIGAALSVVGTARDVGTPPWPEETVTRKVELPRTKNVVLGVG